MFKATFAGVALLALTACVTQESDVQAMNKCAELYGGTPAYSPCVTFVRQQQYRVNDSALAAATLLRCSQDGSAICM